MWSGWRVIKRDVLDFEKDLANVNSLSTTCIDYVFYRLISKLALVGERKEKQGIGNKYKFSDGRVNDDWPKLHMAKTKVWIIISFPTASLN